MADCSFRWIFAAAQLALMLTVSQGRAQAASSPSPAVSSAAETEVRASRQSFVTGVKAGTLVAFDEAVGTVTFKPVKPVDTAHKPGPMEDEVIASAVRAAVAGNNDLRGLKVEVISQAGALRMTPRALATPAQLAEMIDIALNEDGVRQVCAELPASLKMLPAS